jgi:salicylate hydroxylase
LHHETGAAITISPNATKVLDQWGFRPERSQMVQLHSVTITNGATMELTPAGYPMETKDKYGFPVYSAHRVDLHNQLIELATTDGPGQQVKIETGSKVKDYVRWL